MKNKYTFRYVLGGIAFGIAFPIIGSLVEIIASGSSISFESFMIVQAQKPLLWIIDTAPLFLGLFAGLIGARQDQLNQAKFKIRG